MMSRSSPPTSGCFWYRLFPANNINVNQIDAVVGVQPFGGQNLSGTGPKAGGPHYLPRFTTEKTVTANTTPAGGGMLRC